MKSILTYLFFFFLLSIWAQPTNNDCANAVSLTLQPLTNTVYTNGNLGGATQSTTACSGTTSTDVWYSFTANSVGNRIYLPSQSDLDLAFEILDACGGNSIACVDNNSTNYSESYYNNNFVIGQTYYIKVFLYNQSFSDAPFEIAVIDIPAPINDECSNAINLPLQSALNMSYTSVNLGGATESTPACSGNISTDAWFSFTANSVGNRIYMPPHYGLDVSFELLDACNGNSIVCVDRNGRSYSESYYNNNFVVGQTYIIKVYLADQMASSATIDIAVIDIPQPDNDDCVNATSLTIMDDNSQRTTGILGGATESLAACTGTVANDVWFSFTADATELTIFAGAIADFDPVFELYDACNGNSIACVDNNGMNFSESFTYDSFTIGQTYYVRVFGKSASYFNKSFEIVVYNPNAGILDEALLQKWQILPNPTSNLLRINFDNAVNMQVILTNTSGQVLLKETSCNIIDVSQLTKGVYFVNLISDGQNFGTRKLIVK